MLWAKLLPVKAETETKLHRWRIIGILGFTQIVSWGSLYYGFSILAPSVQNDLKWQPAIVFGAFSACILIAGLLSTPVGIALDRLGGRRMMAVGSVLCSAGFFALTNVHLVLTYYLTWMLLGVAMSLTFYEAAFATINRELADGARNGIATLTLFAGFSSTVFWPLTVKLNNAIGWRRTYFVFALMQIALCAPLHLLLPRRVKHVHAEQVTDGSGSDYTLKEAVRHPAFWKLALAFAANYFIFASLSIHLIPLLRKIGHPLTTSVAMVALIGPMQVVGRIAERIFARDALPQTSGKVTLSILPVALIGLILAGQCRWIAASFCILYGLSNGIVTIVRGTIPQALFGRQHYGAIAGALAGPALISQAAGPLITATIIQAASSPYTPLIILLLVSLISLGFYLLAIRMKSTPAGEPSAISPARL
ncbi:MAG TPA: MFS transporter [Candidatus Angelobacter sp.]|nr:MFS transporter [Candidatus Angelobacter sp.]